MSDAECAFGLDCSGRRATCDLRLVFQNEKATLDVSPFGMSTRAVSISGRFLEAGAAQTIDSFIEATYGQVRRALADYLRDRPIDPGDLAILDMEPGPAYLPLIWQQPVEVQERIIAAYKLRIRVARELLPWTRLGLWGVVVPIATGAEEPMERRMQGYLVGEELGLYDDVDYLIPVLYPWFSDGETPAEFEDRVSLATRQGIEKTLLLGRSDGSPGPPLAPMLTFWGRVLGTAPSGGRAESRPLSPDIVSLQLGIIQEYGRVEVIGIWAPNEGSGGLPPVHLQDFLANVVALPAPECECSYPCGAPNCRAAAVGPFPLPDPDDFTNDRRPVKVINLFGGHWSHNVTGNVPWWVDERLSGPEYPECVAWNHLDDGCLPTGGRLRYRFTAEYADNGIPDSIDELLRLLDEAYEDGWRRIVLNRPAGQYRGPDEVFSPSREILPASQFWPMPRWKQEGLAKHLRSWIRHHRSHVAANDISVGIYVGFRITDPCQLSSLGRRVPDASSRADACVVYQNLRPWLKIGIGEVWFDASARSIRTDSPTPVAPQELLQFAQSPNYRNRVRIGGESIPARIVAGEEFPDEHFVARAPFMAVRRFYESLPCPRPGGGVCRPGTIWTVPVSSEVGVGFQRDASLSPLTVEIVQDYVDRGFVPWAWSESGAGFEVDEWIRTACGELDLPCLPASP